MKKLTAGIFTALLGLVTVNAANAAIPSTNYVDTKIGAVETAYQAADTSIRNDFAAADTTTLNSAKTYADGKVKELADGQVATNKTNIASMDTFVAPTVQMTVGEQAQATVTGAINALDARITSATSGLATDGKMTELSNRVDTTETDISGLKGRMDTAESDIDALQAKDTELDTAIKANTQAITNHATDTTNALALKADKSELGALAAKDTVATSDLDSTLQTAVAQVATNKSGIESLNTTVGTKAAQSDVTALTTRVTTAEGAINTLASEKADETSVVERLAQKATVASVDAVAEKADANETAISNLGTTKLNVSEHEANHVVITDATGNVTTSATIEQTQVNGLSDALAAKLPVTAANNANGKYVLTATALNGTITYAWEDISRDVPVEN